MLVLQNPEGNLRARQIFLIHLHLRARGWGIYLSRSGEIFKAKQGRKKNKATLFFLWTQGLTFSQGESDAGPAQDVELKSEVGEVIRKSAKAGWELFLLCSFTRLSSPLFSPQAQLWSSQMTSPQEHLTMYPCSYFLFPFVFSFF